MSLKTVIYNFFVDVTRGGIGLGVFNINKQYVENILYRILISFLIAIMMFLIIKIGNKIINNTVDKQEKMKFSLDTKKAKTLGEVLKSLLRYAVYFFGIIGILTELFGNISLTFASIGGVAIGFGAQNVIKDIINGFFILFEDQFSVGDAVDIESKTGIVESIELRVTKIRDFNGDLHIIPNGLITKVTNHSKGDRRILVSLDISSDEDIDKTFSIIESVCEKFQKENDNVTEGPSLLGLTDLKENCYTIKVAGKVKSNTQFDSENQLRVQLKKAIDEAGIDMYYPKVKLIKEE